MAKMPPQMFRKNKIKAFLLVCPLLLFIIDTASLIEVPAEIQGGEA